MIAVCLYIMNQDFYILHTDGGARGNPGPAASAAVLYDSTYKQIDSKGEYIGETTNNQAEYQGLIIGLKLAKNNHIKSLIVRMDSELIVKQMLGLYKIKEPSLKIIAEQVKLLLTDFVNYKFEHVRRENNKDADALVNLVLDKKIRNN